MKRVGREMVREDQSNEGEHKPTLDTTENIRKLGKLGVLFFFKGWFQNCCLNIAS